MPLDLYAGIYVRDYEAARAWSVLLFGSEPTLDASDTEAVGDLAEPFDLHRTEHEPAGHAVQMLFVDDLDATVSEIANSSR